MGNGISYPPTNPGSLKALPERLDIHHAKDFAGDRWDKELFDALAIGGTVSREQFLLAPLLDRRMFVEAVRITREDHDEEDHDDEAPTERVADRDTDRDKKLFEEPGSFFADDEVDQEAPTVRIEEKKFEEPPSFFADEQSDGDTPVAEDAD